MDVTEVRIKLVGGSNDRLKAFCTITLNGEFVVRDAKIVEGPEGFFVAMPSRRLTDHCPGCGCKNHLQASFCNDCGRKLAANRCKTDSRGRAKLHADMAHPISEACRERISKAVIAAYQKELAASKLSGYAPKPPHQCGEDDDDMP
jgi:stage V sporulation protein G